ncbi:phosphoenolpyruvate carboxykinase [Caldithrix abyssi]|uniref:Phosphoenolpyruvate carboxykinase (ATP) n=1 Tax=Caldithrix abyssi DSM 13497 TaxID=880073 RepID=H1XQM5_CALAY|nr:phosphoenolpyruvate carboxykinase [Caldithrix abyssi]APF17018.1 pckA phosphoenolpyruvate carboxykinase (ATP) [Caldithrix abyssi DSM 13497]EHO41171.1 Phosphoenolpyruvate carboxykinase (ATP) [Caldithrix abyssi DSM 13497]
MSIVHPAGQVPDLSYLGIKNVNNIYWNLVTPALYEQIIRRREGLLSHLGPVVVRTGAFTGRSPNDKFIVKEPTSEHEIWWGKVNRPFSEEKFNLIWHRIQAYLQGNDIFIQDCYVGADPKYRVPIRVITEYAWHSLFARNMFIRITDEEEMRNHKPEYTIIDLPKFHAVPELDGTNSEAFILVNFKEKLILIGGTSYAGEIKKSAFTLMNFLLPKQNVLSMHCSANVGKEGDVALFFGLSGTGKTTLSADPERALIGDDEHGWSDDGVFNFEGGCYAKVIRLSKEAEPEIWATTRKFGTILENVAIDSFWRRPDLDDDTFTENTRASYPITHLENIVADGKGGHPKNIVFLTADAFGVLPPISKLTPEQAMYHFLSGYTAKVAGTERGITEPQATFSTCFGAPFMPQHPSVYAKLLGEKIQKHNVNCWLVNTGWTGGPYGVGKRMEIKYTRAMLNAALQGKLDNVQYVQDPIFKVQVPTECPGVPSEVLIPKNTWKDKEAYDKQARDLARRFKENFEQYKDYVSEEVLKSAPEA